MNTRATYPGNLMADIAATAGVANLNQYVRIGQCQSQLGVVGSWDSPELVMSDEFALEAFRWLLWQNRSDKGDFLHTTILKEGDAKRAESLCNSMYSGDMTAFYREVMTELIESGGHMQHLCEYAFGPDRRPDVNKEHNDNYERTRG